MNNRLKASTLLLSACVPLALLAGCGGGGSSSSNSGNTTVKATVSSVTTDQLTYHKVTNFTITGQNLDKGYTATIPACVSQTELAGGTATQRVVSCKIMAAGASTYTITASDGTTLLSGPIAIPQPQVTMTTSMGTMVLELNPASAPITVDNFMKYVENGFYTNKIFHRVINNLIIQGGGFTADLQIPNPPFPPIKLETPNGLSNTRGTIAMARTNAPDSATSQFYINVANNSTGLDGLTAGTGYAVFGKVVTGLDVMDKIQNVPTTTALGMPNVPVTPVVINSVVQTQ